MPSVKLLLALIGTLHWSLTGRLWIWRYWKQSANKMPPFTYCWPWMALFIENWPIDYEVDRIRSRPPLRCLPFLPSMFAFIYHLPVDYEVDGIGSRPPKRCLPFLPWIFAFVYHWNDDFEVDGISSRPTWRCLLSLNVDHEWYSSLITDRSIMKLTVLEAGRHKHIFSSCLFLHWVLDFIYHWPIDYEVDGIRSRPP